ncbi:DUF2231 domain-containing protein [Lysobacter xanthus]
MHPMHPRRRSILADTLFGLLDPLPYGFFVAALIFDVVYARTAEMMWTKAAAWLIAFGLVLAIVPRLIHLARVWHAGADAGRAGFWLSAVAIVAAIFNAFVHSRDAYAVVPAGQWLSAVTVACLALARILGAVRRPLSGAPDHD